MARTGFRVRKPARFRKRVRTGRLVLRARRPTSNKGDLRQVDLDLGGRVAVDPLANA